MILEQILFEVHYALDQRITFTLHKVEFILNKGKPFIGIGNYLFIFPFLLKQYGSYSMSWPIHI
jgi:hypothetical protein